MLDLLASPLDQAPFLVDIADDLDCTMCYLIKNQCHIHTRAFNNLFKSFPVFHRLK